MLLCVGAGLKIDHLPFGAYRRLPDARWFLQTERMPLCGFLREQHIEIKTMDDLYESSADFDEMNAAIAARLAEAAQGEDIVYAVIGGGVYGGLLEAIQQEAQRGGIAVEVLPGVGYAQAAISKAIGGGLWSADSALRTIAANAVGACRHDATLPLAIEELSDALTASEVKLWLLETYREDARIIFAKAYADGEYEALAIPLADLDRQAFDHTAVALIPACEFERQGRWGMDGLETVVARLRAPGGCPWDREQTHESLKICLLEECYEVLDAIDSGESGALCEELGDLLLQAAMHAQMASERRDFTLRDVTTGICEKLIYRHPHVFSGVKVENSGEVLRNWDQLKKAEKKHGTQAEVLRSVPKNLPALLRAEKVQKKAARVGFDWDEPVSALEKAEEEAKELRSELALGNTKRIAEELGDLLFSAVNVARLAGVEPEFALNGTTERFTARFELMEKLILADGKALSGMTLNEMDVYWEKAKESMV